MAEIMEEKKELTPAETAAPASPETPAKKPEKSIQIGISYGVQSARIGPFVGEALQFINDIVFVGRYVVGCGKLYAEHALVCIERYLPGVAQGVLQDTGFVPCVYFLSVDDEA